MNTLRFKGEVSAPGFLMVCVKCGFVVEYDCGCDGPFSTRDYRDALHFNSIDDACAAAIALHAELTAAPTPSLAKRAAPRETVVGDVRPSNPSAELTGDVLNTKALEAGQ